MKNLESMHICTEWYMRMINNCLSSAFIRKYLQVFFAKISKTHLVAFFSY